MEHASVGGETPREIAPGCANGNRECACLRPALHERLHLGSTYGVVKDASRTGRRGQVLTSAFAFRDLRARCDAVVDDLQLISDDSKTVGIEIHIGWNRVVRRIFESLGYEVKKLDRVIFAGLTKKDLPRGKWRNLSEIEVNMLKMIAGTRS